MKNICVKVLIIFIAAGLSSAAVVTRGDTPENLVVPETIKNVSEIDNNYVIHTGCFQDESKTIPCKDKNIQEVNPVDVQLEQTLNYLQPSILTSAPRYEGYPNVEATGTGSAYYQGSVYPYPHVHPKLLAAYGQGYRGYPINSLPPVLSTYIHGFLPQDEIQETSNHLDVMSPQNTGVLSTVVRPSRMLRSHEEELMMAQLQHDAIMNNMLPTMPVPFARYAAAPAYSSNGASVAVFPNAQAGGCAQPILFSCTPRIIQGTLKPVAPVEYAPAKYRKEAKHSSAIEAAPTKVSMKTVPTNAEEKQN